MAGMNAELQAKMNRFSKFMDERRLGSAVQVARAESPARVNEAYRSGWSRSPQVTPPLGFVPTAMGRSGSVPSLRKGGAARAAAVGSAVRSTSTGALRKEWQQREQQASECQERRAAPRTRSSTPARPAAGGGADASPQPRRLAPAPISPELEAQSEAGASARSTPSLRTVSTADPAGLGDDGPHHEGWLGKRSSAKLAARWQRRYFKLDGPVLRYSIDQAGQTKRIFDIRRARRVALGSGQSRELELDFGFRVWRLRAESVESARRWLLLLEAGQLVSGDVDIGPEVGDFSDDETASTVSSADSAGSPAALRRVSSKPGTPARARRCPHEAAPTAVDRLEVDTEKLDEQFRSWFSPAHSSSSRAPRSQQVKAGLSSALCALWRALSLPGSADGTPTPEAALLALAAALQQEPHVLLIAIESVLGEYLARMQAAVAQWLQEEPLADEVADVATWLLLDARPSLDRFEAGLIGSAQEGSGTWRAAAGALEHLLLSEWESRSCDEVARRVEAVYEAPDAEEPRASGLAAKPLRILQDILRQWGAWKSHPTACERVTSVLIAALNAILRSYRASARHLMPAPHPAARHEVGAKHMATEKLGKAIRSIARMTGTACAHRHGQASPEASVADLARASGEGAQFSDWCKESRAHVRANLGASAICMDLLTAFAGAFEREASRLCMVVVESHFNTPTNQALLKHIRFGARGSKASGSEHTVLGGPLSAASKLLHDHFREMPRCCGALACNKVISFVVGRWTNQFRRHPPRAVDNPVLLRGIEADVHALRAFASQYGADLLWQSSCPVQPLHEIRRMLEDPSSEFIASGAARLEVACGAEEGRALANAVRLAVLR